MAKKTSVKKIKAFFAPLNTDIKQKTKGRCREDVIRSNRKIGKSEKRETLTRLPNEYFLIDDAREEAQKMYS